MLVTIWMCTHEWSLISRRTTAFTFATCHHALSWVSSSTFSRSRRSLRFPRAGTRMCIAATASAGEPDPLADALVGGVARACELVDLRRHAGVHPRVGVADVVPLVPIRPEEMETAVATARGTARRLGEELGLCVFLYGEVGGGR